MRDRTGETFIITASVQTRSEGQWKNAPSHYRQNSIKQLTKNQTKEKFQSLSCIVQHLETILRYNTMTLDIDSIIEDELDRQEQPQNLEKTEEEAVKA